MLHSVRPGVPDSYKRKGKNATTKTEKIQKYKIYLSSSICIDLSWIAQIPFKTKHFFQFEVMQKRRHTSEPDFLICQNKCWEPPICSCVLSSTAISKRKSKGLQDFCLPGFLAGLMGWAAAPWTCCSRGQVK